MSDNAVMLLCMGVGVVMILLGLTAHRFQWINPHDPMTLKQKPASTTVGRVIFILVGLLLLVPALLHYLHR